MDLSTFKSSLQAAKPPANLAPCLIALWYDAKQDWAHAHNIAQDIGDQEGAWVHAYLHRKEGDPGNARYWYNRAGRTMPEYGLEKEWDEIVGYFISRSRAS
jgi:hypothetical protein